MPKILIVCPTTKQPVSTGLDFPRAFFEQADIRETTTKCPACGRVHRWSKKDAFQEAA